MTATATTSFNNNNSMMLTTTAAAAAEPSSSQQQQPRGGGGRAAGAVQLALLRDLEDRMYQPWKAYYVSSERLIPILTRDNHSKRSTKHGSLQMKTVTERFVDVLDDEVDKTVVFFLTQQGQIARDLWTMWKQNRKSSMIMKKKSKTMMVVDGSPTKSLPAAPFSPEQNDKKDNYSVAQQLYTHAVQLLRLVKFVDLNRRMIERLLSLHDELTQFEPGHKEIQALYLRGRIGREAHTPADHHRLSTLLYPDSLRATVGIAATVYYRYMKQQSRGSVALLAAGGAGSSSETDEKLAPVESMRAVPSMQGLAEYLANASDDDDDDNDDDDDEADETNMTGMPSVGDLRSLVLSESVLTQPVASSVQSLGTTEAKLVGSVLLRIDMAMVRLTKTNTMMDYLAALPGDDDDYFVPLGAEHHKDSFFLQHYDARDGDEATNDVRGLPDILEEYQHTVGTPTKKDRARRYSSFLNLANSFLYMVSYYLVAPTSSAYAKRLGLNEAMSGTIIGMTAVAALASTVLYSWWTSHSYKAALVFSSCCCLVGNLVYSAGLPLDSLTLVLVGRLLNGFGSARAINRRYIADAFSKTERTAASADFVASGAAGMSVGPGLAAVMPLLIPKQSIHGPVNLWWQPENAAGWFMAGLWFIYLVPLLLYFEDPPKHVNSKASTTPKASVSVSNGTASTPSVTAMFNGEKQPLLSNNNSNEPTKGVLKKLPPQETPLWERPAALITIFLVFLLKLVLELVLSASAPITGFYFGWPPSLTGWFLAALGLLVLPAIWVVTFASRIYEDRHLILYSVLGTLLGCFIMLQYRPPHYSTPQYMLGTIILFIFPNTMEAPTMSLLSKNIPSSLSQGLFNLGFFTTEAGFSGRVVADSFLTWCGSFGTERLVNNVFGFLTLLNLLTLALVYAQWHRLIDPSKKYE